MARLPRIREFGKKIEWLRDLTIRREEADWLPEMFPRYEGRSAKGKLAKSLHIEPQGNLNNWIKSNAPNPLAVRNIARLFGFAPTGDFRSDCQGLGEDEVWSRWWETRWPSFKPVQAKTGTVPGELLEMFTTAYRDAALSGNLEFQEPIKPDKSKASSPVKPVAHPPEIDIAKEFVEAVSCFFLELEDNPPSKNLLSQLEIESLIDVFHDVMEFADRHPTDWTHDHMVTLWQAQTRLGRLTSDERQEHIIQHFAYGPMTKIIRLVAHLLSAFEVDQVQEVIVSNDIAPIVETLCQEIRAQLDNPRIPKAAHGALKNFSRVFDEFWRRSMPVKIHMGEFSVCGNALREHRINSLATLELFADHLMSHRLGKAIGGSIFRDRPEFLCPQMIIIPACPDGFLMGSPNDEAKRHDHEKQHPVTIGQRFAIGRHAVTFDEYEEFCRASQRTLGQGEADDQNRSKGRWPVTKVSWRDAQDYVSWLNEQVRSGADGTYRLPSEAEWEYACRGDATGKNTTPFNPEVARTSDPPGIFLTTAEANFDSTETYNGSSEGEYREEMVSVDHSDFRPNGFGLWQMHGNVWEWCQDSYESDYDQTPKDGTPHQVQDDSTLRVLRGGSWSDDPRFLRSAGRYWSNPGDRDVNIGFRLSRTLITS